MEMNLVKMHRFKKIIFFFRFVLQKTWEKTGVEVIIFNGKKWLNEKHSNLPSVTLQYSSDLRKQRQELQDFKRRFCNSNNDGF